MKAWIRDNYYMDEIPAKRLSDNALVHIFPVMDDPAEQIPSQRDDGIETILWHKEEYEVFSIDLTWDNSSATISPTSFKPIKSPHGKPKPYPTTINPNESLHIGCKGTPEQRRS